MLANPVIADDTGLPTAEYTANYRDVRWLFSRAEVRAAISGGLQAEFDNDRVIVQTASPGDLKRLIQEMARADRLEGDHAVIRGLAVDENDRPVPHVPVDLLGPRILTNQFLTRADGSFRVPIKAAEGTDYALRFRPSYAGSFLSMPFSLNSSQREVVMKVVIPQEG